MYRGWVFGDSFSLPLSFAVLAHCSPSSFSWAVRQDGSAATAGCIFAFFPQLPVSSAASVPVLSMLVFGWRRTRRRSFVVPSNSRRKRGYRKK